MIWPLSCIPLVCKTIWDYWRFMHCNLSTFWDRTCSSFIMLHWLCSREYRCSWWSNKEDQRPSVPRCDIQPSASCDTNGPCTSRVPASSMAVRCAWNSDRHDEVDCRNLQIQSRDWAFEDGRCRLQQVRNFTGSMKCTNCSMQPCKN